MVQSDVSAPPPAPPPAPYGVVFAASGAGYVALAEAAARSVRQVMPDVPVDLFSDAPPSIGVFDAVHALDRSGHRPKFEALRRTRFARTIYLDVDLRVVADISDVFDILDRFQIAAAHDLQPNHVGRGPRHWQYPLPNAFPEFNSGVIALRRSAATDRLMAAVEDVMASGGLHADQPVFRQLLYESDLALAVLPAEYNMMNCRIFEAWDHSQAAPRVIHRSEFRYHLTDPRSPRYETLASVLGPVAKAHLRRLLVADRTLDPDARGRPGRLTDRGITGQAAYGYAWLLRRAAQIRERLERAGRRDPR